MRLITRDLKHGTIIAEITQLDDLWYLSQLIEPGDLIKSRTSRKIKVGLENTKKSYVLTIIAEKIEFLADSLRVNGTVFDEIEDIPKGSHQSLVLIEGSLVTITKNEWLSFQIKRLNDASKDIPQVLLVAIDRGDASFGKLKQYGIELLSEISGTVEKKRMKENVKEDFFSDVINMIADYSKRLSPEHIIIGSPAFWKDELYSKIKTLHPSLSKKVIMAKISTTGKVGLHELIKRDEVTSMLKQERIIQETKIIDKILSELHKDGHVAYAIDEVETASVSGAVSDLAVTDSLLTKAKANNFFARINSIMKNVETTNGNVYIISTEHDTGKQLDGLGGIAALLRYKLK